MKSAILATVALLLTSQLSFAAAENCTYGPTLFGDSFGELQDKVDKVENKTYTARTASFIKGDRAKQILAATGEKTLKAVFENVDEGTVYRLDFTSSKLPADFYTAIFFYSGDTLVGAIFEGETVKPVARISDDEILACYQEYKLVQFPVYSCENKHERGTFSFELKGNKVVIADTEKNVGFRSGREITGYDPKGYTNFFGINLYSEAFGWQEHFNGNGLEDEAVLSVSQSVVRGSSLGKVRAVYTGEDGDLGIIEYNCTRTK